MTGQSAYSVGDVVAVLIGIIAMTGISLIVCIISFVTSSEEEDEDEEDNYSSCIFYGNDSDALIPRR